MITAVLEKPPDIGAGKNGDRDTTTTPDTPSLPEMTPAPHTKPAGVTEKTWHSLSCKGKIFVSVYVNGESALTAYEVAGYDPGGTDTEHRKRNAYNVKRGKRVVEALLEHNQHREERKRFDKRWDLDEIVKEHERLMKLAEAKKDLAVATRNLELIGRTRGIYADSVLLDVTARREYTEREKAEARHLARLRLEEMSAGESDNGDHRGASMSDSAQDQAPSQGGEMQPADTASKAPSGKVDTRADRTGEGEHEQPAGESGEVVGQARAQVRGASGTSARREGVAPAAAGPDEPGAGDGEGVPGMPLTPATRVGYCGPDTITKPGEEGRA